MEHSHFDEHIFQMGWNHQLDKFDELSISHFFERNGSGKKQKQLNYVQLAYFFVDPLISSYVKRGSVSYGPRIMIAEVHQSKIVHHLSGTVYLYKTDV